MLSAKHVHSERVSEIESYYTHLTQCEEGGDAHLFKILKANLILMLYNLVESTVSNSIDTIRNSIHNDKAVNFDSLKNEIKLQIIKDLKKNINPKSFIELSKAISSDIIKLSFRKSEISNGNIDNVVIDDLAKIYGFNSKNSNYTETGHGACLTVIRQKRNDLAHGTFSFSEVGKEYSLQDLEKYKDQTIKYLEFILNNIESYLTSRGYTT